VENIALQSLQILCTFVLWAEIATIFSPIVVGISTRNTKVYKICKLCKAIFSAFYNISQPNFAILLILVLYALSSCGDLFASPCLVLKLVYNMNCLFITSFDKCIIYVSLGLFHMPYFTCAKYIKNNR
jgi:hypothetical protein